MSLPMAGGSAPRPSAADSNQDKPQVDEAYRTHRRFDRAARLFGETALERLMRARVLVFGQGGVGSFAAEALARSGVGHLVLVDFDQVCVTNTNRQLHAMKGNIGKNKVDLMAERLRLVHPTSRIEPVAKFYNAETSEELLAGNIDFAVDAIDNLTAKSHLIATCMARGIPLVSSMGAAARLDPTKIQVADLAETERDPFARALRKILRKEHGLEIEAGKPTGVRAVFSVEEPREPIAPAYDGGKGFQCVCPNNKNGLHTCEKRNRIDGSAAFVTGAFGLACASVVVNSFVESA
ncbi:MAG: tRNA threonylcarbamoyladenosine dehydratase [Polyangiales bacterium]